jgi:hypothetical protein
MAEGDIFSLVQQFDKMRQGLGSGGAGRPMENPKVMAAQWQQQRQQQPQLMQTGGGSSWAPSSDKLDLVDWGGYKFDRSLVPFLNDFQNQFGGLRLSSGYRDPAHNARVNGVANSRHLLGRAADFSGSAKEMQEAAAWAKARGAQTLIHNAGSGQHLHLEWD